MNKIESLIKSIKFNKTNLENMNELNKLRNLNELQIIDLCLTSMKIYDRLFILYFSIVLSH